jgi:hypothetical protein
VRRAFAAVALLLLLAGPAVAQEGAEAARAGGRGAGPLVKYGKWALLAGSIGMNYLAARAHDRADEAYKALELRCADGDHAPCDLGPTGRYLDPISETLYQSSLDQDRSARRWLLGGEAALAGAAAMFVYELTRPKGRPPNIPFEPEIRTVNGTTRLGVRASF